MSFLRNLLADLVEKRLWPVAVVLAGALVAVPLLLGGGGGATAEDVAAAPAPKGPAVVATEVRVSEDLEPSAIAPVGTARNPFQQPRPKVAPAPDPEPSAPSEPAAPADVDPPASGGGGGAAAPGPPSPSPAPATPKAPEKEEHTSVLRVDLRFGEPGVTRQKAYDDIARLSALPSADDPLIIFLGVKKDRRTATFLVSSDATATGDGRCRPSATNCATIEMRQGDSTFLEIDLGDGKGVRQFRLDVEAIAETEAKDAKKAESSRARMSKAGQEYLRAAIESGEIALQGMDYDEEQGTLTATPRASTAGPVSRGAPRADVRVGAVARAGVRRLAPLPRRSAAEVLFLGVREGGKAAEFLNLTGRPVAGATRCRPSRAQCRRFSVRTGTTATVGATPVTVTALGVRRLPTTAAAEQARTAEDEAGRALVTARGLDLGDLALDPATGTLRRSPL